MLGRRPPHHGAPGRQGGLLPAWLLWLLQAWWLVCQGGAFRITRPPNGGKVGCCLVVAVAVASLGVVAMAVPAVPSLAVGVRGGALRIPGPKGGKVGRPRGCMCEAQVAAAATAALKCTWPPSHARDVRDRSRSGTPSCSMLTVYWPFFPATDPTGGVGHAAGAAADGAAGQHAQQQAVHLWRGGGSGHVHAGVRRMAWILGFQGAAGPVPCVHIGRIVCEGPSASLQGAQSCPAAVQPRPCRSLTSAGDPDALELAASEMATAAASLVSIERAMLQVTANGADAATLAAKQVGWWEVLQAGDGSLCKGLQVLSVFSCLSQ